MKQSFSQRGASGRAAWLLPFQTCPFWLNGFISAFDRCSRARAKIEWSRDPCHFSAFLITSNRRINASLCQLAKLCLGGFTMQGFISYSHHDYNDFKAFQRDLASLEHGTGLKFWSDERLIAGYNWHHEILGEIGRSQVFLMLVSPAYFASKYIVDHELSEIRSLQRLEDRLLIPVILADCDWVGLLGRPQAVPINDERRLLPIRKWSPPDDGFNAARAQIKAALEVKFGLKTIPLIDIAGISGQIKLLTQPNAEFARLQRELRIIEKVASAAANESRINQPDIRAPLQSLGNLARRIANGGRVVPSSEILDQLNSLRAFIRGSSLNSIDPDSEEPVSEQLRAREGLGNILLSVEAAIDAAKEAGYECGPETELDSLPRVQKAQVVTDVNQIISRIDLVQQHVNDLRRFAEEHAASAEEQANLVESFSDRMDAKIDLTLHELEQEQSINFGDVHKNVAGIQALSEAFAITTESAQSWFLPPTRALATTISKHAKAAGKAVRRTIKNLIKKYKPVAGSRQAPSSVQKSNQSLAASNSKGDSSAEWNSDQRGNALGAYDETLNAGLANPSPAHQAIMEGFEAIAAEILGIVLDVVQSSEEPVHIAYLADRAVKILGHPKTLGTNWAGSGGFLNFLTSTLPEGIKVTDRPPPHFVYDEKRHSIEDIVAPPAGVSFANMSLPHVSTNTLAGVIETLAEPSFHGRANLPELAEHIQMEADELVAVAETLHLLRFAAFNNGVLKLNGPGHRFAQAATDERKAQFAKHLVTCVPLAAHITQILKERQNHHAPIIRFQEELQDKMPEEDAEKTLWTVINWARYAEVLAFDGESGLVSLESTG
jgi:hypothetical protein